MMLSRAGRCTQIILFGHLASAASDGTLLLWSTATARQ